jgi:hypothetical protein
MRSKLLIINCPSEYFFHIPMGTFGICDYLSKRDVEVKLLNLAQYEKTEKDALLAQYMDLFQPTHVGIVFQWQETVEGVMEVGAYLNQHYDWIQVIYGGFTAGYFGESLLREWRFVDYVIKGDPEKPLELILGGVEPSNIPNIIYRYKKGTRSNEITYHIDQETVSDISFSEMTYLYDYELYIKAVEEKLGFPLFIGRGCTFNCRYCGGSALSFRLHSGRTRPVVRSIESVIRDLKRIKDFTSKIYICYENDRLYIKNLFKEMKKDQSLVKTFQLNYGAWHLLDEEFLDLYRDVFVLDRKEKTVFELSPEVFDDKRRQKVKHNMTPYSIENFIENQKIVNKYVGDSVNTSLFFSRYHEVSKAYSDMRAEIFGIFRLKHTLLCNNMSNVHVCYDHLSTDVASQYWEAHVKNPRDFRTLLSSVKRLNAQEFYSFPVNNLCLYIPETLSEKDIIRCELLITILKNLEMYFYEMFHIVFHCLDEYAVVVIEQLISEKYLLMPGNAFQKLEYSKVLGELTQKITEEDALVSGIPFIEDMTNLFLKKALHMSRQESKRACSEREHLKLNPEFMTFHDHEYLDLFNFLKRLDKEGPHHLRKEKTVFIFLLDDILSMPYATYSETLKGFEEGMSPEAYYELMKKKGIFTPSYHAHLIERLVQSNVLS